MAKGITYFCNDSYGYEYTRYSAGHTAPAYTAAAVFRSKGNHAPASKAQVSYAKNASYARAAAGRCRYFDATEIVEVRAYAGKLKAEPDYLSQAQIDEMLGDLAEVPSPSAVEEERL